MGMMLRLAIVSILLVGCSNAVDGPVDLAPAEGDAAADVVQVPTLDAAGKGDGSDSSPPEGDAGSKVDTGVPGSDAGPEASTDAGRDAVAADAGSPDSPSVDANPMPDAGGRADAVDAIATVDAAPDAAADARSDATLPCTASTSTCDSVNRQEAAIRATFTQPCVTDAHQCGGLVSGSVVDTVPMTCKAGAWSLAWCLNAACYSCSMQCQANQLCNP
jgi:hypothetical protein